MRKKLPNITNKILPWSVILGILLVWQLLSSLEVIPSYMLPSPVQVVEALIQDRSLLWSHALISLQEAFYGLFIGIGLAVVLALIMEQSNGVYLALYPVLIITQTIPVVAIAPLLVLWMGYGMAPKITLIVIVTFFPIAIGLLDGFKSADQDALRLMKAMGASKVQMLWHIKLPSALSHFYAGLRISVSYAIVGAVISEWLGGVAGLGVYMTRVRKSYSYDKMFAVIFVIVVLSLVLMKGVQILQNKTMPWAKIEEE